MGQDGATGPKSANTVQDFNIHVGMWMNLPDWFGILLLIAGLLLFGVLVGYLGHLSGLLAG